MKLMYKPFSLIAALLAARLGRKIFRGLWSRIDPDDPPEATAPDTSMPRVVGAAALEAATMASVGAAAHRASALVFQWFTGVWPGSEPEKKA